MISCSNAPPPVRWASEGGSKIGAIVKKKLRLRLRLYLRLRPHLRCVGEFAIEGHHPAKKRGQKGEKTIDYPSGEKTIAIKVRRRKV